MPMTKKSHQKSIINKVASKRVVDQNAVAFKAYGIYKKTADIIERAEFAFGKRAIFESDNGSTLDFKLDLHGTYSTTAQTI